MCVALDPELPATGRALANGELSYSAVRELSRVATLATEAAWLAAAAGMNPRQIEELVAGHAPGALPDEPADPAVRPRVVRFERSPETYARPHQARLALDEEHGARLSDDELVAALCDAALDAPTERDGGRGRVPGCRSARGLEIHHIYHRAHGGTHEPVNLLALCPACHQAHHDGRLVIRGTADELDVTRPGAAPPRAHVGTNPHRADAVLALTTMGWRTSIARRAVDEALGALASNAPLAARTDSAIHLEPLPPPRARDRESLTSTVGRAPTSSRLGSGGAPPQPIRRMPSRTPTLGHQPSSAAARSLS